MMACRGSCGGVGGERGNRGARSRLARGAAGRKVNIDFCEEEGKWRKKRKKGKREKKKNNSLAALAISNRARWREPSFLVWLLWGKKN